jgi:hypothetical protein
MRPQNLEPPCFDLAWRQHDRGFVCVAMLGRAPQRYERRLDLRIAQPR